MDNTTLPDAASPSAATPRSISFPAEILVHIISYATELDNAEHYSELSDRNVALVELALLSRAFRAATYSILYGDLRLPWMADTVKKLHKSFSNNPNLLPLVRRLEAFAVSDYDWVEYERFILSDQEKAEWLEYYCAREEILEGSNLWQVLHAAPVEEGEARREWDHETGFVLNRAWIDRGRGAWTSKQDSEGALELLDMVASAPTLRSLALRRFVNALDPIETGKRGPFPLIKAFDSEVFPFTDNKTLPAVLVSSAPNLRSDDLDSLALVLAPTSSLRHLELSATATLITSLPPSLQSITLLHPTDSADTEDSEILPIELSVEIGRVLELLKATPEQPLRVEFAAPSRTRYDDETWLDVGAWTNARGVWEAYRDLYTEEGHTLSLRPFTYQ